MRYNPLSLIVSAAALLGCSLASAQTLTIDSITTNLQNLAGQSSVTIDPATGNVVVRSANGSACAAAPQPTASLTAQSTAISAQSVTVTWSSTNTSGSTPCQPSSSPVNASWNVGALAAAGTRSVTMPTVNSGSQIQQLTMTCTGAAGTTPAVSTTSITVSPVVLTECTGAPEAGLSSAGATRSWVDVFGQGALFPNPFGNAKDVFAGAAQFTAISFTTPSAGTSVSQGNITSAQGSGQGGPNRISLSKCLGDFRPSLRIPNKRCMTVGDSSQQTLNFLVGTGGTQGVCNLEPQTPYYFNLTFKVLEVSGTDPEGPVSAGDCGNGQGGGACNSIVRTGQFRRDQLIELGLPTDDVPGG